MGIREKSEERRKTKKRKKSRKHHYISSSPASSETSTYSDGNRKKKNREVSKKHQHVSSSPSSSEISTYSDEKRKKKKRKQRRISSESDYDSDYQKQRKRRHSSRCGKEEKKSHGRHSSKRTNSKTISDIYEDHDSKDLPGPEEVGSAMLHKFPELADDLRQLLKMLDEGQAVDLSGLENDHVATYLKQLFQSLQLRKTGINMYFLPEGAPMKTLDVLSSIFLASAKTDVSINQSNSSKKEESQELNNLEQSTTQYGPSEQRKRVLGPAMPSAEMLEAAAQLTQAGPSVREVEEDIGMEPFIGPPPPAAVKEAESSNEAERFEEVERILTPDIENAYELLGLRVGAAAESMKKRYWKLSLLVHPDKCTHPRAHEAFTALNQAFKDLQDPAKRAKIEEQIQEKETRAEFEAEQKAKREAAEWRKIRGESLPGDEVLLGKPRVMVRDEWMTQLPPERKEGAPSQQSTFFSRYGKSGRGDTSVWTDTPLERMQKAKTTFIEGQRQGMMESRSSTLQREEKNSAVAGLMDEFNSSKRAKSLVEKHQMGMSKKSKKTAVSDKGMQQPAEWEGSHPWKPWDREKDLTAGRQKVNLDASKMREGLQSRFSASHQESSFL